MEEIIKIKGKEIKMFDLKPCKICPQSCVEGISNEICPFDKLFINEKNKG